MVSKQMLINMQRFIDSVIYDYINCETPEEFYERMKVIIPNFMEME